MATTNKTEIIAEKFLLPLSVALMCLSQENPTNCLMQLFWASVVDGFVVEKNLIFVCC